MDDICSHLEFALGYALADGPAICNEVMAGWGGSLAVLAARLWKKRSLLAFGFIFVSLSDRQRRQTGLAYEDRLEGDFPGDERILVTDAADGSARLQRHVKDWDAQSYGRGGNINPHSPPPRVERRAGPALVEYHLEDGSFWGYFREFGRDK